MRCVFILPGLPSFGADADFYVGSAYKYGELLKRLCTVDVLREGSEDLEERVAAADFCVVRADRYNHYRLPLRLRVPYLAIAHDLATMRDPTCELAGDERELLENATAVLFATKPLQEYAADRYRLPKQQAVIALRPLARDLDFSPLPKITARTLVYAGGLVPTHQSSTAWGYRANLPIFQEAIAGGWEVHLYPTRVRPQVDSEYRAGGCIVHAPVPERHLLAELSQYGAGLQVFNVEGTTQSSDTYARLAWPNKTWLYLAAGIPTVGVNPGFEATRFYNGRWGIVLRSHRELCRLRPCDLPPVSETMRRREVADRDLPLLGKLIGSFVAPRRRRRVTRSPD